MRYIISLLLMFNLLVVSAKEFDYCSFQDDEPVTDIDWTDFETAIDKNKEEKRPIFIDIYTNWCGWCKKMDQSTFKEPEVVKFMNENYYAVKMDAESKEPIAFKETLYEYRMYNGKGYNELAVNLLGGKMSFPTFVILSKREVKIADIKGFQNKTQLLPVLQKYAKK